MCSKLPPPSPIENNTQIYLASIVTVTSHHATMVEVKPYICRFSISDHPLPFPIHVNSRLLNPISLRPSQSHPTPTTIVCAKRSGWSQLSNRKMLQLASTIAFNLKILPEPLNSLAGEIARGDCEALSRLVGGRRGKIAGNRRVRKKKSVWFAFVLICVVGGLWSWRIREFELFLRALSFCLAGISLVRLWLGKKAVREGLLGFFFGIVLILSSRLGKEDLQFWVQKLTSAPVTQIYHSSTAVMEMYARCDSLRTARDAFNKMPLGCFYINQCYMYTLSFYTIQLHSGWISGSQQPKPKLSPKSNTTGINIARCRVSFFSMLCMSLCHTVTITNTTSGIGLSPLTRGRFLMYFIMGTYFGPDIKGETTKKSILQRVAEGLPPYTLDQLTNSFIKVVELERVYYHILRKSDKSLILKLTLLRRFFQGQAEGGGDNANYPQFPDLFPPELHPQSRFKNRHKVIHNVVFINNPDSFYLKPEDVERFKRLSGVEELHVDRDAARLQLGTCFDGIHVLSNTNMSVAKVEPDNNVQSCGDSSEAQDRVHVVAPTSGAACGGGSNVNMASEDESDPDRVGPAMLFLPSRPSEKELSDIVAATNNGFALTGSAAMGQVGPVMGLMDIGECEDSYLFRVSLPGVKRDEREFSCEVGTDGKVLICGVTTTGEKTVSRYSQVFEMQTHNLCPPGQFSISFQLPGPVDPHQFSGNFGTDGILEGIVMKGKCT
ncbi:Increased DNA methylation 2 [Spatholobus suberectus]|nr:Increased DNA methylation 2 [Spatholobus suberectus]